VLAFLIPYAGEWDPARKILRARVNDPAQVEALTRELGLDRPLYAQYLDWLRTMASGDFGFSSPAAPRSRTWSSRRSACRCPWPWPRERCSLWSCGDQQPTSRDFNKALVVDVVLSRAPLTRNQLIELTGLSKATVSRAGEELRADGLVVDGGVDAVSGRGRRSTNLDVPGTAGHVVGISFGAQTTGVLVTDLCRRETELVIVPTVDHRDVKSAAVWLVDLVARACESAAGPLRQIVAAVPGRVRNGTKSSVQPSRSRSSRALSCIAPWKTWSKLRCSSTVTPCDLAARPDR
jgi:DNA-binding transcriptional ArsR family regulator